MLALMSKSVVIPELVGNWSWLPAALADAGRTQADLAAAWGVARSTVTRFIDGSEGADPRVSRLVVLARMLGCSIDDLLVQAGIMRRAEGAVVVPAATTRRPALPGRPAVELVQLTDGRVRTTISAVVSLSVAAEMERIASEA